jgi:Domain of unknown function (DUF5134)
MTPAWILDTFAAIMLAVAAVSVARLAAARPRRRPDADIDTGHLLMGIAMAGMLAPGLRTLPDGRWAMLFGLLTAWFARAVWREARGRGAPALATSHHAPHLLHGAAMLYTFLALTAPAAVGGGPGMGGMVPAGTAGTAMPVLRLPALALIFALLLAGYTVRDLDLLSGGYSLTPARVAPATARLAPATAPLAAAQALPAASHSPLPAAHGEAVAPPRPRGTSRAARGLGRPSASALAAARSLVIAPGTATTCRVAMGLTMAFMMIMMI